MGRVVREGVWACEGEGVGVGVWSEGGVGV